MVDLEKHHLLALDQFALSEEEGELKERLYKHLVIVALSSKEEGLTIKECATFIAHQLGIVKFNDNEVHKICTALEQEGKVTHIKTTNKSGKYILTGAQIKKSNLNNKEFERLKRNVINTIVRNVDITKEEDPTFYTMVQQRLESFLGMFFNIRGYYYAQSIIGLKKEKKITKEMIKNSIDMKIGEGEFENIDAAIIDIISSDNNHVAKYLYAISTAYMMAQVLNLDPTCQKFSKAAFSEKTVYIDTNVLYDLITGTTTIKKATRTCFNLSSKMGVKFKITQETIDEYKYSLKTKVSDIVSIKNLTKEGRIKFLRLESRGFPREYCNRLQNGETTSPERFVDIMLEIEEKLKEVTPFIKEEKDYGDIKNSEKYFELIQIMEEQGKFRSVAEHDSYHILLMEELRSKDESPELGPKYWFLTTDHLLEKIDAIRSLEEGSSVCVKSDNWLQLMKCIGGAGEVRFSDGAEMYSSLFSSRLPVLSTQVPTSFYTTMMRDAINDPDIGIEAIKRIVGKKVVRKLITKIDSKELTKVEREETQKRLNVELNEIKSIQTKEQEKNIIELRKENNRLTSEFENDKEETRRDLATLLDQVAKLTKKIDEQEKVTEKYLFTIDERAHDRYTIELSKTLGLLILNLIFWILGAYIALTMGWYQSLVPFGIIIAMDISLRIYISDMFSGKFTYESIKEELLKK